MKRITFYCLFALLACALSAQVERKPVPHLPFQYRNSVQLELFGHGIFYSLNYEGIFANGPLIKGSVRVGGAYYPRSTGIIGLLLPVTVNGIASFGVHHLEVGAGMVPHRDNFKRDRNSLILYTPAWSFFGTGRIAYRYQKPNGRLVLMAAFTPLVESFNRLGSPFSVGNIEVHPVGGLSVGYAF